MNVAVAWMPTIELDGPAAANHRILRTPAGPRVRWRIIRGRAGREREPVPNGECLMVTATQHLVRPSPATASAAAPENPKRLFALTAVIASPLAYVVTLLLLMPVGGGNAALIAVVPALFAAAFFGSLYGLAGALERDESTAAVGQRHRLPTASRAA